jgi:hypothetical protein
MVIEIEMTVLVDVPGDVDRAVTAMCRCASGLAMEGMSVSIDVEALEREEAEVETE